jgi:chromosome segregation ATPase
MGVSQNNISNMRNLIGGVTPEQQAEELARQEEEVRALLAVPAQGPYVDPYQDVLNKIDEDFGEIMRQHELNKKKLEDLEKEKSDADARISELTAQLQRDTAKLTEDLATALADKDKVSSDLLKQSEQVKDAAIELSTANEKYTKLEEIVNKQKVLITTLTDRLKTLNTPGPGPDMSIANKLAEKLAATKAEMALVNK